MKHGIKELDEVSYWTTWDKYGSDKKYFGPVNEMNVTIDETS